MSQFSNFADIDELTEALERLLQADAEYRALVRTSRSHQLAIDGLSESSAHPENS
jgi:hypothetical protein